MKIPILLGSVRTERQSYKVAYYLEKILQKRGISTDLIDLAKDPLPLKLLVSEVHLAFNESLEPLRKDFVQHTHKFLDEFLWFAQAIVKAKSIPEKQVA